MIITDKLVFLNFPKTGSTFIREFFRDISKLERKSIRTRLKSKLGFRVVGQIELLQLPNLRVGGERNMRPDDHGLAIQVPRLHHNKPFVSCIRNPFERLVSAYKYEDWKKLEVVGDSNLNEIRKLNPKFPDLTFPEFIKYVYDSDRKIRLGCSKIDSRIGMQTIQFFQFFHNDYPMVLEQSENESFSLDQFLCERFLHTENLNDDLAKLLIDYNYPDWVVAETSKRRKINTSSYDKPWYSYYDLESWNWVKSKEEILLDIFPEYNKRWEDYAK